MKVKGAAVTSGTTASDGTVTLQSPGVKKPVGEWCFDVTNVTHGTLTYDPGSNVTTRSCESGDINGANDGRRVVSTEFSLDQNSPNPFNPMTEIKFNLPRSMNATLTVYNVRGQVVETLKSGIMSAGQHSVTWDARSHASGVYFYRLQAGALTQSKSLVLIR